MTHVVGMIRCAVCKRDTAQPIELRRWADALDEQIEASVCSGDCAKAWIDGEVAPAADEPASVNEPEPASATLDERCGIRHERSYEAGDNGGCEESADYDCCNCGLSICSQHAWSAFDGVQ